MPYVPPLLMFGTRSGGGAGHTNHCRIYARLY